MSCWPYTHHRPGDDAYSRVSMSGVMQGTAGYWTAIGATDSSTTTHTENITHFEHVVSQ